jgi:hypothetical protein
MLQVDPTCLWRRAEPQLPIDDDRLDLAAVLGGWIAGLVRSAERDSAVMASKQLSKARVMAETHPRKQFQGQSRRSDRLARNCIPASVLGRFQGVDTSSVGSVRSLRARSARYIGKRRARSSAFHERLPTDLTSRATGFSIARLTHRSNIQRYRNLLKTSLTELERQFVQKRLVEEQSNLESLAISLPDDFRGSKADRPDSRLS